MEKFPRGRPDGKPSEPGEGGAAVRTPSQGDGSSSGSVPLPDSPTLIDIPGPSTPVPSSDSPTIVDIPSGSSSDSPTMVDIGPDSPTMVEGVSPAPGKTPAWKPRGQSNPVMLAPGALLGQRYEVLQILGEGGMGAVYKARDIELNRMVALKVIRPDLAGNQAIIDRFKQELLLATQVTHKNVIRIYDLSEADGMKFITMEYVEGEDLRGLMQKKGKLAPLEAVEIMQQTCRALDAAHSAGIIHRDLKPQNIMRDKTGRILVMDFGLARTLEGDGMTQTGALVGTMDYMSPEQALGKDLDQRSDLFAMGLIFYELLTGKMPYKADSVVASLLKRTQERAAPVSSHDGTIPVALSNIVGKCMEPDVKLRYQSSAEILADLDAYQGGRAAATLKFPTSSKPWGQTIPWHWIGGAVAVVVLAVTGFLYRDKLFNPTPARTPSGPVVSLAILPFRNASGDPALDWLGPSVAEMLSTDVGQSSQLRTVSPDRLHQVLADLHLTPNASLDPTALRHLADFTNADILVSGQYARFGDQIRIDAVLQDLKHDRRIPLKVDVPSEKEIPGAVDRLAESVRQNLSVSRDVLAELKASSFQPTSSSVPALRDYNQGVQLLRGGKNLEAVKAFQSAIGEDPNFALAYSNLAEANSALGYDSDAEQASRKAVELSQQSPLAEKYLIQATYAHVIKDNKKAIEAYENLAKSMPDNADVEFALGSLYTGSGDYDKARAQLSNLLKSDPKNLKALRQLGLVEITDGKPQAALESLNKGLSLAVQTDNQEMKALFLHAIGISYGQMNKPDDAMSNYQDAIAINRRLGLRRALASNLLEMASVENSEGKPDAALAGYNQALQIQREIGMKKEVGDTLIFIGVAYQSKGDYDKALQNFKEALQIHRDNGNESTQALCLNNIGNVYSGKGDNDNALIYLQQALQLREKLKSTDAISETLASIGQVYINTGRYDEALPAFMRSLDLRRKDGDTRGVAEESHDIGMVFEYQGRLGAAVGDLQDAVKGYRDVGDRSVYMVELLNDLAEALAQAGRGPEAAPLLQEVQSMALTLKNDIAQAEILNTQGNVQRYRGDWKAAQGFYDQALRAASRGKDPDQVLISKLHLAEAAQGGGRAPSAVHDFRNLTQQAGSRGLKYLSLQSSVDMAEAMINSKDYAHAQQELQTDLITSEKMGSRYQSVRIHNLLGNALRLSGNAADASGHYRQALSLIDDMRKEPGAEKLLDRADLKSLFAQASQFAPAKN
jgi:serine/threonine protein kinase/tetratricopeptide (TPR) repeat protein